MSASEFQLINQFFANQNLYRDDVIIGIGDDCAVVRPIPNELLAVSIDTCVEGVHFPVNTSAQCIGHKTLAVSLSDMAAMGANPQWATLAITLPKADESWIADYCQGFFDLANRYNVQLVGGDITKGSLTITTQLHGSIPQKDILKRSGAQIGDLIYVTGTIGTAGLGLLIKQQSINIPPALKDEIPNYIRKLECPEPRVEVGLALRAIATAVIDVSDGLAADLGHILQASDVGAEINLENIPVTKGFDLLKDQLSQWQQPLTAGDDYELCFTAPPSHQTKIQAIAEKTQTPINPIGVITENKSIQCLYNGELIPLELKGFEHF